MLGLCHTGKLYLKLESPYLKATILREALIEEESITEEVTFILSFIKGTQGTHGCSRCVILGKANLSIGYTWLQ